MVLWVIAGLVVFVGCGPRSDRLEISGEVRLDGAPLDDGTIRFTSLGPKMMAAGAQVENGEFNIPQEKGLLPATYHVSISAPDAAAPPIMTRGPEGRLGAPVQPDRIPRAYNLESTLRAEVTADGDNYFQFDLDGQASE
jgi:hypothetical protein